MRKASMAVLSGLMVAGSLVAAVAADAITERQTILKGIGDDTRPAAAMLKGDAPFDLAKVKTALKTQIDGAAKLPSLYPDNSRTGKTEASPMIWADKERFLAIYAKLGADAQAALVSITDEASFKTTFPKVLSNCKACHDDFRLKR